MELGSSDAAHNGKGTAKQHMDKSSKRHSKKEKWQKRSEEDVLDVKGSVAKHWAGKDRHL